MHVAIMQPFFVPWIGYYELIANVNCFVILDDVEISKQSWQTRNVFTTNTNYHWKSVPIKGSSSDRLNKVQLNNPGIFLKKLNRQLEQNLNREAYRDCVAPLFEMLNEAAPKTLSDLNMSIIKHFVKLFQIKTEIVTSSSFEVQGSKDQRIINLLKRIGATTYLAAPGSRTYIEAFGKDRYPSEIHYFDYSKSKKISIFHDDFGYENSIELISRLSLEKVRNDVIR